MIEDNKHHGSASEEDGERVELAIGDHLCADGRVNDRWAVVCTVSRWTAELSVSSIDTTKVPRAYRRLRRQCNLEVGNVEAVGVL